MRSVWDLVVIAAIYKSASFADAFVSPENIELPHPLLYPFAKVSIWALYTFFTGLFATGLWVIAHECGHQSFSESKTINNAVGFVLHSAYVSSRGLGWLEAYPFTSVGVPYHSWRKLDQFLVFGAL